MPQKYAHCVDCGKPKSKPNQYPRCRSCSKKKLWENKEFRAKQAAYKDEAYRANQREKHIEIWADQENRELQRQTQLEVWSDSDLRARHSGTLRAAYAEVYADEERYAEVCAKLDELRAENWKDPEYRAYHSRLMTERNGANYGDEIDHTYDRAFTDDLREQIRDRDYRRCVLCGKTEEDNGKKLDVHHINYNKHDSRPGNLMALCTSCHWRTNHNRKFWKRVLPLHFRKLKQDWQHRVVVTA